MYDRGKIKRGVEGWLLVLILSMMILWPLMALGTLLSSIAGFEAVYARSQNIIMWEQSKMVMWMLFGTSALLSLIAGWRLYVQHTRESVSFAMYAMWIAWPVLSLFMVIAAAVTLKNPHAGDVYSPAISHLVISVLGAIIGTMYLKRSVRVQNTYRLPIYLF